MGLLFNRSAARTSALKGMNILHQHFLGALSVHQKNPRDLTSVVQAQVRLDESIPYFFHPDTDERAVRMKGIKPSSTEDHERARALAYWIKHDGKYAHKRGDYVFPYAMFLRALTEAAVLSSENGYETCNLMLSQVVANLLPISAHPANHKRDDLGDRCIEYHMNALHDVWMTAAAYQGHRELMRKTLVDNIAQIDAWKCWPDDRQHLHRPNHSYRAELIELINS